jgi:hypothetical protein
MAEKRTIELEIQDNSKSLKAQYREAVQELQKLSQQYGETSEQAVKAAKSAAELKDQIEFSKDLIKGFNPDAKFAAAEGAINGVMNGIQAFEGGLALIGVESDKVQEALLRVQSVMALTQGINGVMEAGDAFAILGKKAGVALKGIKTELIATGIGAFVVALGTVVAYWDEISEAVSGVSSEQKALNKLTAKNQEISNKTLEDYENQNFVLKLQGKSDKEILKGKIKLQERIVKDNIDNLKNVEETAKAELKFSKMKEKGLLLQYELYKYLISIALDFAAKPIDLFIDKVNSIADAIGLGKLITFNTEDVKKTALGAITTVENTFKNIFTSVGILADETELNKQIKAADSLLKKSQNELAQSKLELRDMDIKSGQSSVNNERENAQEKIDITRQMEEETNRLMAEGRAKELDALRIKYKYEQQEADKNFKEGKLKQEDYDKLTAQAIDSKRLDDKAINDKYDKIEKDALALKNAEQIKLQDEQWYALQKLKNSQKEQELLDLQIAYDKEYELAGTNAELQKELTEKFGKDYAAINKKYADAEKAAEDTRAAEKAANRKKLHDSSIQAAHDTLQVISNLTEVFAGQSVKQQKKAFQIQKAVNISSAVIDTYTAATKALKEMPTPFNYIAMAATITAGLLNVKKIASQKFEGGGSTGGGGGGSNAPAAAPMTANFNTIGSSGINQLAQLQQTPTQAYVVSGEVTSAQALDRNRVQNATL